MILEKRMWLFVGNNCVVSILDIYVNFVFMLCVCWFFVKGKVVWVIWEMCDIFIVSLMIS